MQFDGQVRDAQPGIDLVRRDDGPGRAGLLAGSHDLSILDLAPLALEALDLPAERFEVLLYQLVSLVRDVIDRGLSVAIGAETGVEPLSTFPYEEKLLGTEI